MKIIQLVTRPMHESDAHVLALCDDGTVLKLNYGCSTRWTILSSPTDLKQDSEDSMYAPVTK